MRWQCKWREQLTRGSRNGGKLTRAKESLNFLPFAKAFFPPFFWHWILDTKKHYGVCIEINANHVGSVMSGFVTGTATLLHCGKTTHVWNIEIKDEKDKLISFSRLTMMILEHQK